MKRAALIASLAALLLASCALSENSHLFRQGQQLLESGRASEAAAVYRQGLSRDANNADLLYNYLYALYESGSYEAVISESAAAIEHFPYRLEFNRLHARALLAARRHAEAESAYSALIALNPADYPLYEAVMESAHASGADDLAKTMALHLLDVAAYERKALTVLAELEPQSWYALALAFLTPQH